LPNRYNRTQMAPDVLKQIISRKRFRGRLGNLLLRKTWKEAVGDFIADNTRPLYIKGEALILAVESSSWANEIQFYKDMILENVNAQFKRKKLTKIRVKVTNLPVKTFGFNMPELPEIDELDMERTENITENIKDDQLKESIQKAYQHCLRKKKWESESILEQIDEESANSLKKLDDF